MISKNIWFCFYVSICLFNLSSIYNDSFLPAIDTNCTSSFLSSITLRIESWVVWWLISPISSSPLCLLSSSTCSFNFSPPPCFPPNRMDWAVVSNRMD